jgi:hypothetical protein
VLYLINRAIYDLIPGIKALDLWFFAIPSLAVGFSAITTHSTAMLIGFSTRTAIHSALLTGPTTAFGLLRRFCTQ